MDEWYNYQSPENRARRRRHGLQPAAEPGVHVLATVDEATYDEEDGNTTDDDHPISWCQRYDGGRSWYTGMGHTQATFDEAGFRTHLLGGLRTAAGVVEDADCGAPNQAPTVTASATPASGQAPLTVAFAATATDPDGDAVTYAWAFGDGATGTGATASHTYAGAGTYIATVTATDADGATATASVTITVSTTPPPVVETSLDTNRPTLYGFRNRGLKVTVECGTGVTGPAVLTMRVSARTADRLDLVRRRVGRERVNCAPGRVIELRMFPSNALERALKREKPRRIEVEVLLDPPTGPTLDAAVTIRR